MVIHHLSLAWSKNCLHFGTVIYIQRSPPTQRSLNLSLPSRLIPSLSPISHLLPLTSHSHTTSCLSVFSTSELPSHHNLFITLPFSSSLCPSLPLIHLPQLKPFLNELFTKCRCDHRCWTCSVDAKILLCLLLRSA